MSAERVADEVLRLAGLGVKAAAIHLSRRVKEVLSVPAPRRRARSARTGVPTWRATLPAAPGAPPRKLSGRLRASVAYEADEREGEARVGTNVVYGRRHELGDHPFLVPALEASLGELAVIIGRAVR